MRLRAGVWKHFTKFDKQAILRKKKIQMNNIRNERGHNATNYMPINWRN